MTGQMLKPYSIGKFDADVPYCPLRSPKTQVHIGFNWEPVPPQHSRQEHA